MDYIELSKNPDFEHAYSFFVETIDKFNMVPLNKNKVYIYYSGGKDASLLIDLFLEYKKRKRTDLIITLLTIDFPHVVYKSKDFQQAQDVKNAIEFWEKKGIRHKWMHVDVDDDNELFKNQDFPCSICEKMKIEAMNREMNLDEYNDSLVCLGHTLDDVVGGISEIIYLCGTYNNWQEIENDNKELFKKLLKTVRWVYPLYSPKTYGSNFTYIKPLMVFEEHVIRKVVETKKYPLIKENCAEFRGEKFKLYKRIVNEEIEFLKKQYSNVSQIGERMLFRDFEQIYRFLKKLNLIPPLELVENYDI